MVYQHFQLCRRREGAHGGGNAARQGGAEDAGHELQSICHQHAYTGAVADPAGEEGACHFDRARPKVCVAPALDAIAMVHDSGLFRTKAGGDLLQVRAQCEGANTLLFVQGDTPDQR